MDILLQADSETLSRQIEIYCRQQQELGVCNINMSEIRNILSRCKRFIRGFNHKVAFLKYLSMHFKDVYEYYFRLGANIELGDGGFIQNYFPRAHKLLWIKDAGIIVEPHTHNIEFCYDLEFALRLYGGFLLGQRCETSPTLTMLKQFLVALLYNSGWQIDRNTNENVRIVLNNDDILINADYGYWFDKSVLYIIMGLSIKKNGEISYRH